MWVGGDTAVLSWRIISRPRVAAIKLHKLGPKPDVYSLSSDPASSLLSSGFPGRTLPASPNFRHCPSRLPAAACSPWLVASALLRLHRPPSCLTLVLTLRAHSGNPGWSYFEIIKHICKNPFFQIRPRSQVPRSQDVVMSWVPELVTPRLQGVPGRMRRHLSGEPA